MKIELLFACVAILVFVFAISMAAGGKDTFSPKRLMTKNEEEFYVRLTKALPDFYVFPQVALRALVQPGAATSNKKAYFRQNGRIGSKYCDFLVCALNFDVVAIIELDDRTHSAAKDAARDAMTGSAGFKTIRYNSRKKPQPSEILSDVRKLLLPAAA